MTAAPVRLALLTEIISPYRIPVLNALAKDPRVDLTVFFYAVSEPRRSWHVPAERIAFHHEVLPGLRFGRVYRGLPLYVNPAIIGRLRRGRFDCVFVGGYQHPTSMAALAYARTARIPTLLFSESTARDTRPQSRARGWAKRKLVGMSTHYVAPGRAQADYLVELGASRERIHFAPDAVDDAFFRDGAAKANAERDKLRKDHDLSGSVLLNVGRMTDEKGIPDLLEAFQITRLAMPGTTLVLAGTGPELGEYQRRCARDGIEGVRFLGYIADEELPMWYAMADVFVFPTRSDPWGLVVNEAMAAGLPIVASTAAGAVDEMVHEGVNGLLHAPGDVAGLARALTTLVENDKLRREMGAESARIAEGFTPERMAQGIAEAAIAAARKEHA